MKKEPKMLPLWDPMSVLVTPSSHAASLMLHKGGFGIKYASTGTCWWIVLGSYTNLARLIEPPNRI